MTQSEPDARLDSEQEQEQAAPEPAWKRTFKWIYKQVIEYWFIFGLGVAIGIAAAVPDLGKKEGWVHSEWSVKYGAVIIIFLLSGISLKTKVLADAMSNLRTHLVIQCISLGFIPAVGYGIAKLMGLSPMNDYLVQGIIICTSMPTTVSTNVVYTKAAGGNDATAVVNSVLGNILGVFVTPALLLGFLGKSGSAPYSKVFQDLGITVIAPLVVGQVLQFGFPNAMKSFQKHVKFSIVSSICILLLVWATFSSTFADKNLEMDAGSVVAIVFLDLFMFFFFAFICLAVSWYGPFKKLWGFDRADVVAVVNCGATKTVALGVPLINVLYGKTPKAGLLAIPLLVYHATQILVGGLLIRRLKAWRYAEPNEDVIAEAGIVQLGADALAADKQKAPAVHSDVEAGNKDVAEKQ